jgi:uncharacterized membrane protein (DUF485 family)
MSTAHPKRGLATIVLTTTAMVATWSSLSNNAAFAKDELATTAIPFENVDIATACCVASVGNFILVVLIAGQYVATAQRNVKGARRWAAIV